MLATIALSSVTGLLAIALGLRALGVAVATLVPWVPLLVRKLRGDWLNFGALALFETLVILQLAHFAEHVSQVIELHWLQRMRPGCSSGCSTCAADAPLETTCSHTR